MVPLISFAEEKDSLRFRCQGLMDGYGTLGKSNPLGKIPYLVSSSNLNAFQLNVCLMEFSWENNRWKFALSPAYGTYMQQNYAAEKWYKRWIYEAYVQRNFKRSTLALGVFSSPYTQETPKSSDHICYSRSLAPEYVPYYISGLRFQVLVSKKCSFSLFAMNGWQKMNYSQFSPSIGSLLTWKQNDWILNWSTYFGQEQVSLAKEPQTRFLSEWNAQYSHGKFLGQACAYYGTQGINFSRNWWQFNCQMAYFAHSRTKIYGRVEYFSDPTKVQLSTGVLSSESIGINYHLNEVMNIGTEFRCFQSEKKAFEPYQFLFFQLKF